MIITSRSELDKNQMFIFLCKHKVNIPMSSDFQAIGNLNVKGEITGVVGYNGFCGKTCMIHVAGDGNWASKMLLWAAFDYPFNQAGMVQLIAPVPGNNAKALKLDYHLGFKDLHVIKDGWDIGVDLKILTMAKEECRWLERKSYDTLKVQ